MTSAAFTIDGTAVPKSSGEAVSTTYSTTVALALSSIVGVETVTWTIAGVSGPTIATPTITRAGTPLGATATFATMADPGTGVGVGYGVKCTVKDGNGTEHTAHGIVGVPNAVGFVPFVYGETLWRHATVGWLVGLNGLAHYAAPPATVLRAGYDFTFSAVSVPVDGGEGWVELESWPISSITADDTCRSIVVELHVKEVEAGQDPEDVVTMRATYQRYDAGNDIICRKDGVQLADFGPAASVAWEIELPVAFAFDAALGVLETRLREDGTSLILEARSRTDEARTISGQLYLGNTA